MLALLRSRNQKPVSFPRLSRGELIRLTKAFLVVAGLRLALLLLPYPTIRKLIPLRLAPNRVGDAPRRVPWRVSTVARLIPGATCLTQALATQLLLARAGHTSQIRIGVAKGDSGNLAAHAWVVIDETVLIGGSPAEIGGYTVLTELGLPS